MIVAGTASSISARRVAQNQRPAGSQRHEQADRPKHFFLAAKIEPQSERYGGYAELRAGCHAFHVYEDLFVNGISQQWVGGRQHGPQHGEREAILDAHRHPNGVAE